MSSTYTASAAAGVTPGGAVQITSPADGDALTAASSNVGAQKLADYCKKLVNSALFKDVASGSGGDSVTGQIKVASAAEIQILSGGLLTGAAGSVVNMDKITYNGTTPASTVGFSNAVVGKNIVKCWGKIGVSGSGTVATITVSDGFNIASTAVNSNAIRITFATAMANANYTVIASQLSSSGASTIGFCAPCDLATGSCSIMTTTGASNSVQDPVSLGSFTFVFAVLAAQ